MKRKFLSMGVALSICMCALFGTGCSNPDVNNAINGAASYTSTQGEVYNFATKLVKEQLDAPSTAIFPTFESSYVTKMDGDGEFDECYKVQSSVECENALGGRGTMNFTVLVGIKKSEGKMYGQVRELN